MFPTAGPSPERTRPRRAEGERREPKVVGWVGGVGWVGVVVSDVGVEPKIGGFGTPKMDGENNGKPYETWDDLGVPLFLETPTCFFFFFESFFANQRPPRSYVGDVFRYSISNVLPVMQSAVLRGP